MHEIAQNGVKASHLRSQTLHKLFADFTQPLIQDDTVDPCVRSLRSYWHGMVWYDPGWVALLTFASSWHKGIVMRCCPIGLGSSYLPWHRRSSNLKTKSNKYKKEKQKCVLLLISEKQQPIITYDNKTVILMKDEC